ncbi:MAG: DUF177 domain-containing protein [Chloroflexi bacterium]|nr:DUF177 domain-containing protein [Chloroflexota bacterium]
MQINVAQQIKGPIGSMRNYQVDEVLDIADADCPVWGEVTLTRTDRGILVQGTLHTEVELTCSRCLCFFNCQLTLRIEDVYYPTINVLTGASLSSPEEPGSLTIDENNILDLSEAIRQYALLATPMKPLCRDDCEGLCPTCGCNLNQESCKCLPGQVDPRRSELAPALTGNKPPVKRQKGTK